MLHPLVTEQDKIDLVGLLEMGLYFEPRWISLGKFKLKNPSGDFSLSNFELEDERERLQFYRDRAEQLSFERDGEYLKVHVRNY